MSDNEAEFLEEQEDGAETEKTESVEALSELEQCKEVCQTYLDGWQRTKADFANLKKRSAEDVARSTSRATESFVESLLPTLDSFDMAFKDKDAWEQAPEQWRKGVEYIYGQLQSVLENYNVVKVGNSGEPFNHEIHEPVETITVSTEAEDNIIKDIVRPGYKMGDVIIRPAHVTVGNFEKEL